MTFDQMLEQAKQLGLTVAQMRQNCLSQRDQYLRLSRSKGDKWDRAASECNEMLHWLTTNTIGG